MTNDDRANRAQTALDAYCSATGDVPDESHFRDLLCDLMHLAARDGAGEKWINGLPSNQSLTFDEALEKARSCFEDEDGSDDDDGGESMFDGVDGWTIADQEAARRAGWELTEFSDRQICVIAAEIDSDDAPPPVFTGETANLDAHAHLKAVMLDAKAGREYRGLCYRALRVVLDSEAALIRDHREQAPDDISVQRVGDVWRWDWQNGRDSGSADCELNAWREAYEACGAVLD